MSADKFSNPVVRWIDHRLPIFSFMDHELNEYPTPKNLKIKEKTKISDNNNKEV